MTYRNEHPRDEFQDQLPPGLVEDLHALYGGGGVPSSPTRDQLILSSARAHLAGRNRFRPWRRWGGAVAAAAAAVLLLAILLLPDRSNRPQHAQQAPAASPHASPNALQRNASEAPSPQDPRDLNTDGQVNILDAYLLAKQAERTEALDRALDLNADGRVDRSDADALAADAVRLKGADLQ